MGVLRAKKNLKSGAGAGSTLQEVSEVSIDLLQIILGQETVKLQYLT